MKRIAMAITIAALGWGVPASASVYGDDLTKCVIAHSSTDDNDAFIKWMFIAMAANPKLKSLATITDAERSESNRRAGAIVSRLLTKDCRAQTVAALKYDGTEAVRNAFELFGKVAMGGIMNDPAVEAGLGGLDKAFDQKAFDDMLTEAGLKKPST